MTRKGDQKMDLKFGDIQETALIPLAIKASETARPNYKEQKIYHYLNAFGLNYTAEDIKQH